jgi:phosphoglycerate dehydrogenase-like enzyme
MIDDPQPTVMVMANGIPAADLAVFDPIGTRAELIVAADPPTLQRSIGTADVLFVWDLGVDLDAVLPDATRLRWIHAASAGVDELVTPTLRNHSVTLTNSRGVFDLAMAEYVLGLYLMHLKGFRDTLQHQQTRSWKHRLTRQAAGTSAVVVGTGSIGRQIARMLVGAGVDVTLVGRRPSRDSEFGNIRAAGDLADIVVGHDLVVLAAPLTPHTRHLVDATILEAMRGAYLINVGRGALVDQGALIEALGRRTIGGAALDVFEREPLPLESALWSDPNTIVSPHMSGDFVGSEEALVVAFTDNLDRWLAGELLRDVVDLDLGYVASSHGGITSSKEGNRQ